MSDLATRMMDLFDHRGLDTTGYMFTMPHTAISGHDLPLDYDLERKQWKVTQTEGTLTWTVYGDGLPETILTLIAARLGFDATFTPTPDELDREVAP